jgi:hypothetical protein
MKKAILFLLLAVLVLPESFSQAKRYIFLEHFTNTRCGICANSNPGFFNLLTNYKDQYHHMSVHPPIPYSNCLLYQANPAGNSARMNYHSIFGTPTVVINGLTKKSAGSVTAANLNAELNKTSPVQILVKEAGLNNRTVNIEIKTVGNKPSGNYKLYVAAVERVLNYASPNGEKVHYNVFRDFLNTADGETIDLANDGSSVLKSYSITIPANWVVNQIYILAWIHNADTKEVLNSGTAADVVTSTSDVSALQFNVFPNPVEDVLHLEWQNNLPLSSRLSITNVLGKEIYVSQIKAGSRDIQIPVQDYSKGIYFVRIQNGNDKVSRKWIKQ